MVRLIRIFASDRHLRLIRVGVWAAVFALTCSLLVGLKIYHIRQCLQAESRSRLQPLIERGNAVRIALQALKVEVKALPCSAAFRQQMRKIAFLPDGLSEFFYAPHGIAQCSFSGPPFDHPFDLGKPDLMLPPPGPAALWFDRELAFMGLGGARGSIVLLDPFAVAVPKLPHEGTSPSWMDTEIVVAGQDGQWRHRGGKSGIYERFKAAAGGALLSTLEAPALREIACSDPGVSCVVSEVTLAGILTHDGHLFGLAVVLSALLASWVAARCHNFIRQYWSFEARFRRHLSAETIVCVYQPILNLRTDAVTSCEVLARWRDIDDTIVYPDKFLDVVKRHGLTRKFTRLVAERAFRELSTHLDNNGHLDVHFNIFAGDLDCDLLKDVFKAFEAVKNRFTIVAEVIETEEIAIDLAQREIAALRSVGIKVSIDDFGTGFSNIQKLAALTVDSIKLDRSFAMAADHSLMAEMLPHAIAMAHAMGRPLVVEGIETAERLAQLRANPCGVDYGQGYFISRPLDVAAFAAFLAQKGRFAAKPGHAMARDHVARAPALMETA